MTAATLGAPAQRRPVTAQPRPRYAVRPAPQREPPFDDEPATRHLSLVGPMDQLLPFEPVDPHGPSTLRLSSVADPFATQPTGRQQLPELATLQGDSSSRSSKRRPDDARRRS